MMDLYCHPAEIEAEAISCIEAIACGKVPIIANSPRCATKAFAVDERSLFKVNDSKDLARKIDHFIEHPEEIKELSENNSLLTVNLSDSFWTKLKMSVDAEFNGIVSFVENRYHNMSETDIKLFSLLCAKISPQIIKVCMNYTNSKTSSTYRNRMIKKKIGLDMTFDEFIEQYMNGDIS